MLLAVASALTGQILTVLGCIYGVLHHDPALSAMLVMRWGKLADRLGVNPRVLKFTGLSLIGLFIVIAVCLLPAGSASAQFFNKTSSFMKTVLTGYDTVVDLIVNAFRLIFVIFVISGIVKTFSAQRSGDEWQEMAKTPVFVTLAGVLGDMLVGAITGGK